MEFCKEPGRIFATDETGKLLAEVTFPEQEGIAVINHTFVDGSLRGRGLPDSFCAQWPILCARMAARPGPPVPTPYTGLRLTLRSRICWYKHRISQYKEKGRYPHFEDTCLFVFFADLQPGQRIVDAHLHKLIAGTARFRRYVLQLRQHGVGQPLKEIQSLLFKYVTSRRLFCSADKSVCRISHHSKP